MTGTTVGQPRAARIAVSAQFFINGALIATLLPRLPAIKAELGLTNAALGAGIAFGPAGALLASSVAGLLVGRFGSGRLAVLASALYGVLLPLVGLAPAWAAFAAAVFLIGACDGIADVAQNAHGLRVQSVYGRSVINGFHAWWSVGGVTGAAASAVAAAADVPLVAHFAVAGGILAVGALVAGRWLLPGPDPGADHATPAGESMLPQPPVGGMQHGPAVPAAEAAHGAAGGGVPVDVAAPSSDSSIPARSTAGRSRRTTLFALAGIATFTLLAAVVEDVPGTWGAVYLRDGLGASAGLAGLAFAAFTAGMTGGRIIADRGVDRWGHIAVVRAGGAISAAGLASALVIGTPAAGLVGFFLVGLGAAPAFPALFYAAGHQPGLRPATGIAIASWAARAGFLIAPPLVGLVADATTLAWAAGLGVVASLGVMATAGRLRTSR